MFGYFRLQLLITRGLFRPSTVSANSFSVLGFRPMIGELAQAIYVATRHGQPCSISIKYSPCHSGSVPAAPTSSCCLAAALIWRACSGEIPRSSASSPTSSNPGRLNLNCCSFHGFTLIQQDPFAHLHHLPCQSA